MNLSRISPPYKSQVISCVSFLFTVLGTFCVNGEEREWMSRQGGTLNATLDAIRGDEVVLVTSESKRINLKTSDLSLADRLYLIEFGGADDSIIEGGKPGTPEKDVRLDSSKMNKLPDKLALGAESEGNYQIYETPHFWVATNGRVRPNGVAETAERLWHGMAFQHVNFRKDWGDRRMLIIAVEDRDAHKALGEWVQQEAAKRDPEAPNRIAATWDQAGATNIILPDDLVQKHDFLPKALVFNVKDSSRFRGSMGPFQINCIAGFLITHQMGGISSISDNGYYALRAGHAYYKEILLGGKSETNQLAVEGSGDEVSSKSGFKDGRSWARTLRTLVRKETITPDLKTTLSWTAADLDPTKLVTIYAFSYYMQSDSQRLSSYSRMIRRIETSNQVPEPIEIARLFGFESVEDFNADWKEFVLKGDFR